MKARQSLLRATVGVLFGSLVGCGMMGGGSAPAPTAGAAAVDPATQPVAAVDPHSESTEALARKTAAYAASMEAALAKRVSGTTTAPAAEAVSAPVAPATQPAVIPSVVKWVEPEPFRISSVPVTYSQVAASPLVKPTVSVVAPVPAVPTPAVEAPKPVIPAAVPSDAMEQQLLQRIRDNPRDVAGQFDYQLLQFLRDQQVPQMSAIASLPAEDRELLSAIMDGLSNFRNCVRADQNMLLSKKIRPMLELADRLRSQASLAIPTVALCTRVDGFGVYQPIEPARFAAGRVTPLILYCEVENFRSEMNESRMWQTRLTEEIVLYTESGLQVWPAKSTATPVKDLARNRRHDFFLAKRIDLPANLTIGQYLLKVTIVDQQASRVAEATVPIQIVAQK